MNTHLQKCKYKCPDKILFVYLLKTQLRHRNGDKEDLNQTELSKYLQPKDNTDIGEFVAVTFPEGPLGLTIGPAEEAAALGAIANASRLSTGGQAQTAVRELPRLDAAPALLALLAAQTQGGGGDASIDHILGQMQSSSTLLELFDVVPELDHTAAAPGRRARGAKPSAAAAPPADVSPEAQQLAGVGMGEAMTAEAK